MKKLSLFFFFMLMATISYAQQITCSPKDKKAFENKTIEIDGLLERDFGETLVAVGKTFLNVPYVAQTLEIGTSETLVVNLQGLDCTTFVENVLAFSFLVKEEKADFESYVKHLETIRYKSGVLNGYASRLHYFTEWISDNEVKGVLRNITSEIGGEIATKQINFMSTNRDLYPFLKDDDNFEKIKASENYLNNQEICILPQDQIATNEHLIKTGDIIALTTSIKGLDVTHTGIATREEDGRIHLLHASTNSKKVEISELPLVDYLKKIWKNTGIIVSRPNFE